MTDNTKSTDGSEYAGNESQCQNCGLDFPKRPLAVGLHGLQNCLVCDYPTTLGRTANTTIEQSEDSDR